MDSDMFAGLGPGIYLVGDDGGIDRYSDREAARQAAINCSTGGIGCSIIQIEERYNALPQPDDNANLFAPATLFLPPDRRAA